MKFFQPQSRTKWPVDVRRVLGLISDVEMAFDRLTFWIDHPAPDIPSSLIKRHCGGLQVRNCYSLPFHPAWQTEIAIFQPGHRALIALQHAIQTRHRTRLGYAEAALDWLVDDYVSAQALHQFMLGHLRVPYMRQPVWFEQGTAYFARLAAADGTKNSRNVVLYADRESKLWPAGRRRSPCCHLEFRLDGVGTLAQHGLHTLSDCIEFDHRAFWKDNLRLFRLPSKVELGRQLAPLPQERRVSGTALAKRANRFLGRYRHNETFVLQNCWRDNPTIADLVTVLDNTPFIGD